MERRLTKSCQVAALRDVVWSEWTEVERVTQWFCSEARIELRPNGPYELLFLMDNPPGLQGGEGNKIQSFEPQRLLAVTWNAPPQFGPLRDVRTWVQVELNDIPGGTAVTLIHYGWRSGPEWEQIISYFDRAWDQVMNALTERLGALS